MIYLFTHISSNNTTKVHKFYHDGKIYIHSVTDNEFYVDNNYKDVYDKSTQIHKFEYTLPKELIIHHEALNDSYSEITDFYITKAIFNIV